MFSKYNSIISVALFLGMILSLGWFGMRVVYSSNAFDGDFESYIEITNLLLITIVLVISFNVSLKMGGVMKDAVNAIMLVLSLFWIKEFVSVLIDFKFLILYSITDIAELLMIVALLFAINKFRRLLQ